MTISLIDQIIESFADCMSLEAAQRVVAIRADDATQVRLDALAEKANFGILTESEKAEYDRLLAMVNFVALLQARVRKLLLSHQ